MIGTVDLPCTRTTSNVKGNKTNSNSDNYLIAIPPRSTLGVQENTRMVNDKKGRYYGFNYAPGPRILY